MSKSRDSKRRETPPAPTGQERRRPELIRRAVASNEPFRSPSLSAPWQSSRARRKIESPPVPINSGRPTRGRQGPTWRTRSKPSGSFALRADSKGQKTCPRRKSTRRNTRRRDQSPDRCLPG